MFPISEDEAAEEVVVHALHRRVVQVLDGQFPAESKSTVETRIEKLVEHNKILSLGYTGSTFRIPESARRGGAKRVRPNEGTAPNFLGLWSLP